MKFTSTAPNHQLCHESLNYIPKNQENSNLRAKFKIWWMDELIDGWVVFTHGLYPCHIAPDGLRPASVQLPSCFSQAESDGDWLDVVGACGELRRPASPRVALSIRGQSGGQAPCCAEEKDPRGRCHPAQLPLVILLPPASIYQQHPPTAKPRIQGGLEFPEDIILHWQIIQHLYHNVWKTLLLDMQDIQLAVWFMEFALT